MNILFIIGIFTLFQLFVGTSNVWIKLGAVPLLLYCQKINFKVNIPSWFKKLTFLLILLRTIHLCYRFYIPARPLEDLAIMNIKSIELLFKEGKNPYTHQVDSYCVSIKGEDKCFLGQKYPSFQMLVYAPGVLLFSNKEKSIYFTNLIFYLLTLFFFMKVFPDDRAHLAIFLFLSVDFIFTLNFHKGTNDLPASLLLFSGLYFSNGLLFGLSLAFKQLPAGIIFPYLLFNKNYKMALNALLTFGITQIPFMYWDFHSYFQNCFYFHLIRPARETSFLIHLPHALSSSFLLLGFSLCLYFLYQARGKEFIWDKISLALSFFLLFNKMSPSHYFVWVVIPVILWFCLAARKKV